MNLNGLVFLENAQPFLLTHERPDVPVDTQLGALRIALGPGERFCLLLLGFNG